MSQRCDWQELRSRRMAEPERPRRMTLRITWVTVPVTSSTQWYFRPFPGYPNGASEPPVEGRCPDVPMVGRARWTGSLLPIGVTVMISHVMGAPERPIRASAVSRAVSCRSAAAT